MRRAGTEHLGGTKRGLVSYTKFPSTFVILHAEVVGETYSEGEIYLGTLGSMVTGTDTISLDGMESGRL